MKFNVALVIIVATILGIELQGFHCKTVQFIFGDSLSDVGNNKYLPRSLAQASLPWYGIDMGNGLPNGRFSNGRTVSDIIGDKLGLPRPPAFLDPSLSADVILENGVNYASGGGGILNETGTYFIQRLSLYRQIELFQGTQELVRTNIGKEKADTFFKGANYVVALGSNDFINNYLMPLYSDSWTYNDETFIEYLTGTLEKQLKLLHSLGARQVTVFGLGPMGCIPLQRVLTTSGNCQEKTNNLALSFNNATSKLIDNLMKQLPNSSYKFGDAYDVVYDVINYPSKYGFQNADSPCCSFGRIRPSLTCLPASTLCKDRSKYVFWDEYHPTDSANELIANELIKKFGLGVDHSSAPSQAPTIVPSQPPIIAPSQSPVIAPSPDN
ncbi:hypothetical protein TanjilG_18441 [Lupinus angustifolius]|uniref:GDSL esterase/lipase n=1 Tax=Lupinus angustifolius TaxID=3871 RepID=A0A4P1RW79_LUPAN|nr:PREDICTED: GDSL esterase/lipase At1g74460 [Lupinus angustifolius]OIW19631.1 hypothetical protein TanjilG_18441 [Lupinus angustifolius]